ncbi:FAD-dependent monooxygenase [Streptomyces sp. SP18BB07]|uniref:FAD-dependent monooxygenase n=1 Tax=Streptomyces sp. SP18BB07 TaxID=3002522 RepID=UPI002E7812BF|nr:FAD-dependent monooxygenase [Streptomyces sp. SP18BB07]MEE1765171.1 FAD-dependent monooxygenase [Streptomyces sp. SP18BB07]
MSKPTPPTVETTSVLVVGAGPVGLTLAMELEHHGVEALLVERNTATTQHPKMDVTNGRSMELYRRLGVADDLRKIAIPTDHRTKVTWATSAVGWELASFEYPSVDETHDTIRDRNDGTLPLEPWMRVSQVILEPALRDLLEARSQHVKVQYGWALESFEEDTEGVTVHLVSADGDRRRTVRARYLAGCDGAGSRTRKQLGIGLHEIDLRRMLIKELGIPRTAAMLARAYKATGERPLDGRIYLVHFTTPDPGIFRYFGNVWHLQSPQGWTLISQNDSNTFTLHAPLSMGTDADRIDPREFVYERVGRRFEMNVLVANAWTPRLTVADSYGRGRVWLAGDAVHQVPPTGGYGMNTGVGDAVGLGWALAAVLQGWGTPGLLRAYEHERRAVALRNRAASARHSAVRGAVKAAYRSAVHSERWLGARARQRLGREINDLGNLENEALGIELGYRYDTSPVVCHEPGGQAPPQTMDEYTPSTWPGARPPSVLLRDGRAIFDLLHAGFTLLRFADHDVTALAEAAAERCLPLKIVDVRDPHARTLYERDLVLIRPDQHVAWRGDTPPADPPHVIDRIRGAHRSPGETS